MMRRKLVSARGSAVQRRGQIVGNDLRRKRASYARLQRNAILPIESMAFAKVRRQIDHRIIICHQNSSGIHSAFSEAQKRETGAFYEITRRFRFLSVDNGWFWHR